MLPCSMQGRRMALCTWKTALPFTHRAHVSPSSLCQHGLILQLGEQRPIRNCTPSLKLYPSLKHPVLWLSTGQKLASSGGRHFSCPAALLLRSRGKASPLITTLGQLPLGAEVRAREPHPALSRQSLLSSSDLEHSGC